MKHLMLLVLATILSGYTTTNSPIEITGKVYQQGGNVPLAGVNVLVKGTNTGTTTDLNGWYSVKVPSNNHTLVFSMVGFTTQEIKVGTKRSINIFLQPDQMALEEMVVTGMAVKSRDHKSPSKNTSHRLQGQVPGVQYDYAPVHNTEEYATIHENIFLEPTKQPLSTFSIDVDAASYSNIRRFLKQGQHPPKDAVRIEEMVNYFTYDYPEPDGEVPFSVNTELSTAPWDPGHQLLHIGLQGRRISTENLPPSNLVFLIDVSGSMNSPNKLGLLKSAFKLLTNQLRAQDKVAMVVYAGAAGVVLPATAGSQKQTIIEALNQLQAGGSTAGGEGIKLAYKIAQEQFIEEGNNRVILATDGDFNVGVSSNAEMERLIESKRENGVFLTVLGFGMGNYKDSKMEILADKGNGNYAYIDDIMEAKKVLVNEFGGTLFAIAKDVKLQIEFNPTHVKAYRLIGYENRKLRDEDFNDDTKDAGELGSGHTVTALYEIIPVGSNSGGDYIKSVDDLKYQKLPRPQSSFSQELMTLKLRYKHPRGSNSRLITKTVGTEPVGWSESSANFRWSASVASFGMLLRDSEFKGDATYALVQEWARNAKGLDPNGYRAEFIRMVQSVDLLAHK